MIKYFLMSEITSFYYFIYILLTDDKIAKLFPCTSVRCVIGNNGS